MLQHGVHGGFRHKVIKKHEKWNPQENPLGKTLKGTLKGTLKETENNCSTGKLFFYAIILKCIKLYVQLCKNVEFVMQKTL